MRGMLLVGTDTMEMRKYFFNDDMLLERDLIKYRAPVGTPDMHQNGGTKYEKTCIVDIVMLLQVHQNGVHAVLLELKIRSKL